MLYGWLRHRWRCLIGWLTEQPKNRDPTSTQHGKQFLHVFEILPPADDDKSQSRHRLKRVQLLQAPHLVDNIEVSARMCDAFGG